MPDPPVFPDASDDDDLMKLAEEAMNVETSAIQSLAENKINAAARGIKSKAVQWDLDEQQHRARHRTQLLDLKKKFLDFLYAVYVACAVIFLLANIAWALSYFAFTWLNSPLPIAVTVNNLKEYRSALGGFLQMGWGFVFGGLFTHFSSAISLNQDNTNK